MNQFDLQTLLSGNRIPGQGDAILQPQPNGPLPSELVALQTYQTQAEILRVSTTTDETGGSSETWIQVGKVLMRVEHMGLPQEVIANPDNQRAVSETPYTLHMPLETDLRNTDRIAFPGWFNAWRKSTSYNRGDQVIPASDKTKHYYEAQTTGSSAALEPPKVGHSWPTQPGATVTDNGVIWKEKGRFNVVEIVGVRQITDNQPELVAYAKEVV